MHKTLSSKFFLFFALSFIFGIFFAYYFSPAILLGFFILGVFLITIPPFCGNKKIFIFGICILIAGTGMYRYHFVQNKIYNSQLKKIAPASVVLFGTIYKEPEIREASASLVVVDEKTKEKIIIFIDKYNDFKYGDFLIISGKLRVPESFNGFDYQAYLAKEGISTIMYRPEIEVLQKEKYSSLFSVFYADILKTKEKMRDVVYSNISPPQREILAAMLLGDKRRISSEWQEKLNYAGTRHVTAVSGLHVTVLTAIIFSFWSAIGFNRRWSFWLAFVFMFLYILLTGTQISAVRAGIMGSFFLFGKYLGRSSFSFIFIVFAAAIMLAFNPLLLRSDIGFQLSFMAILGIIYLSCFFKKYLKFDLLAVSISAYLFTLPAIIYHFGYFSLVAPLANVLIVPALPFILLFGFLFVFTGIIYSPLGWIFSFLVLPFISYLVWMVHWFANLSAMI